MNKLEQLNTSLSSSLDIENITDTLIVKAYDRLESSVFSLAEQRAYKAHSEYSALYGDEKAKQEDIWAETERRISQQLTFSMTDVIAVAKLMLAIENIRADDGHHMDVKEAYSSRIGH
ncbi:MAG: hypothetical protein HRU20_04165 [Pseudomonadales bacterium]|nr:hypothetical protein [Pseudomonadales bacterium]